MFEGVKRYNDISKIRPYTDGTGATRKETEYKLVLLTLLMVSIGSRNLPVLAN